MKPRGLLLLAAALGVIFLAAAFSIYRQREAQRLPPGFVFASGRLEAEVVTVATRIPGRVKEIHFTEGKEVKRGDLLAQIEAEELKARRAQALAGLQEAQARLQMARATLEKAQVAYEQARRDQKRYRELRRRGVISQKEFEKVELLFQTRRADLRLAREGLKAAQKGVSQAKAALQEVEALLDYSQIKAPITGAIIRKLTNVGEMLSAGGPLCLMADLDQLYLKAYVPEREIGLLALGQEARVYVDAFPKRGFPARVGYIARKAEFTPKEVQTRAERVKMVYAVKLYLQENPGHILTPGMPADALIRISPEAPWPKRLPR